MSSFNSIRTFLFTNKRWGQIVLKNAFWLALGEGTIRALKLLLVLVIARYFGPTEYGKFAFAFSFVSLFVIVFDAGLLVTATKEFSADPQKEELLPDFLLMKISLGLVGVAMIGLGMFWITGDSGIRATILVLGLYLFVAEMGSLFFAVSRARQRMEYESYIRITQGLLLVVGVSLVMWKAPSVPNVSYAYLVSAVLTLAIIGMAARQRLSHLRLRLRIDVWKRVLRVALPLALVGGAAVVYMNIDSVMLGSWGKITETGWYNVATRFNAVMLLPASLFSLALFPAFMSTAATVGEAFQRRWNMWISTMIAFGFFCVAVVMAAAVPLVVLLFGEQFRQSGLVLHLLTISALLIYAYTPCHQALILFDQQNRLLGCFVLGALVNVALNALLIPRYGLYGAASATVVTHIVILCQLVLLTAKYTPIRPVNGQVSAAVFVSAMSGLVAYLAIKVSAGEVWLSVPAGASVFVLCLIGLGKAAQAMAERWRLSSTPEM